MIAFFRLNLIDSFKNVYFFNRTMGMGISLFEYLDKPEASVELVHQYRMNK